MDCTAVCGDGCCTGSENYCACPDECPQPLLASWDSGAWEGWTAVGDNWSVSSSSPWTQDNHARFSWFPSALSYSYTLTSPVFDLEGCFAVDMDFEFSFSDFDGTGNNALYIECTRDGVSWVSVSSFSEWLQSSGDHAAGPETSWLDPCNDSATVQVRFRITGDNSYGISHFAFDDIDVHKL